MSVGVMSNAEERFRIMPNASGEISYFIAAAVDKSGFRSGDRDLIVWALQEWERSIGAPLRFRSVDDEQAATVRVRGLPASKSRDDYYELWLTKGGKPADSCGRFILHEGVTEVTLTVPYGFKRYDGWIVTRRGSTQPLLST